MMFKYSRCVNVAGPSTAGAGVVAARFSAALGAAEVEPSAAAAAALLDVSLAPAAAVPALPSAVALAESGRGFRGRSSLGVRKSAMYCAMGMPQAAALAMSPAAGEHR